MDQSTLPQLAPRQAVKPEYHTFRVLGSSLNVAQLKDIISKVEADLATLKRELKRCQEIEAQELQS